MLDFKDFKKISTPEWKLKIQADLKGKEYDTLITKTAEQIDIRPFYHYDEYKSFENLPVDTFTIVQEIHLANEKVANTIIKKALTGGAEKIIINSSKAFDISSLTKRLDFSKLIFRLDFLDPAFFIKLYHKTKGKSSIRLNPIGHLIRTGNWYYNSKKDFELLKEIQMEVSADFRFIEVSSAHFLEAGANINQQLAYALSQAVEYLEGLNKEAARQMVFHFAIGNHYFFEIAKLKVFRYLWKLIQGEYQMNVPAYISVIPGLRNKSLLDPSVNILRTTMESMSGILGGTDEIANRPYDQFFKKSNAFSERIARNQLIILKEEAGFEKAINSMEGSYFLEHISREMAEKSLSIFKIIEDSGGFLSQLMKGKIQEKVAESAHKEQEKFDAGKLVLVGVNKYRNEKEEPEIPGIYPFMKKRKGQTLIPPVIAKRLAEKKEKEFLKQKGIDL